MPLGQIARMPKRDDPARKAYDFAHYMDHLIIAQQISRNTGKPLAVRPIWPVPKDFQTFLQNHEQLHKDMASAVSGFRQHDLLRLDDSDERARNQWSFKNYQDHINVRAAIGLTGT